MRSYAAMVLLTAALTACGSSGGARERASLEDRSSAAVVARTERCVDRLLQRSRRQDANEAVLRRYARDTYCKRFERNGWIYSDGVLSIATHIWAETGGTCSRASVGEPARTVPCDEVRGSNPRVLDCALLHHVRRSEVTDYIERLRREDTLECDDGTPVDDLGVP